MGAWIETANNHVLNRFVGVVAPYMGAWIETVIGIYLIC